MEWIIAIGVLVVAYIYAVWLPNNLKRTLIYISKLLPVGLMARDISIDIRDRSFKKIFLRMEYTAPNHVQKLWVENKYNRLSCWLNSKQYLDEKWRHEILKESHRLVGEVTLSHAWIEMNIRNILINSFGCTYESVIKLSGSNLRIKFEKKLKGAPNQSVSESLGKWLGAYRKLSKRRNEMVKTSYVFIEDERYVGQVNHNLMLDDEMDPYYASKELDLSELKSLMKDLKHSISELCELERKLNKG